MECFEPPAEPQQHLARLDVVAKHATSALYNAVEHRRIPFRWVWVPHRPAAGRRRRPDQRHRAGLLRRPDPHHRHPVPGPLPAQGGVQRQAAAADALLRLLPDTRPGRAFPGGARRNIRRGPQPGGNVRLPGSRTARSSRCAGHQQPAAANRRADAQQGQQGPATRRKRADMEKDIQSATRQLEGKRKRWRSC